jgi:hypothetical protein
MPDRRIGVAVSGRTATDILGQIAPHEQAGRPVPPLIAHAPVCGHEHAAEVRAAVRQQVSNPRLPSYQP